MKSNEWITFFISNTKTSAFPRCFFVSKIEIDKHKDPRRTRKKGAEGESLKLG